MARAREYPLYTYEKIEIDLATARNSERMAITGNYIKAVDATDIDTNLDVALNSSTADLINIKKGRSIRGQFFEIYITNTAQAAKTITIVIAQLETITIRDDGIVGDIDTIQEIVKPVAVNHLPDKIISDQGLTLVTTFIATTSNVDSATTIIYTVPSNKIFYLARLSTIPKTVNIGGSNRQWQILNSGGGLLYHLGNATVYNGGANHVPPDLVYDPWIKLIAGITVRLYNRGTCTNTINGIVFGHLKDA